MNKLIKKAGIALAIIFVLVGAYLFFFNISPAARLPKLEDMVSVGNLQSLIDDDRPFNLSFLVTTKKIYDGPERIQGYAVSPMHRNRTGKIILKKEGIVLHQLDCILDSFGIFLFDLPNFGEGTYLASLKIDGKLLTQNYFLVTEPAPQQFSTEILRVYWYKNNLNVWGIVRRNGRPFQGKLKMDFLYPSVNWGYCYFSLGISDFKTINTVHCQAIDGNFNIILIPNEFYYSSFPPFCLRIWVNENESSLVFIFHPKGYKSISEMGNQYLASFESGPEAGDIHGLTIVKNAKTNTSPWRLDSPVGKKILIQAVTPLEKAVVYNLDPMTLNLHRTIFKKPKRLKIAPSYPFSLVDIYARSKTHEYFDYAILLKEDKASTKMELRGKLVSGNDLEVRIDSRKRSEGILIVSKSTIERENLDDLFGDRILNPVPLDENEEYLLLQAFSGANLLDSHGWPYPPMGPTDHISFTSIFHFKPPPRPRYYPLKRRRDVQSLPKAVDAKETPGIVFFDAFPIDKSARKTIKMPMEPGNWKAELIVYYKNEYRFDRIEKSFRTYDPGQK